MRLGIGVGIGIGAGIAIGCRLPALVGVNKVYRYQSPLLYKWGRF